MPTNRFEVTKSGYKLYDENNDVVGQSVDVSSVDDAHIQASRAQQAAQYAKIVNKEDVEPVPAPETTLTPSADEGTSKSGKK